MYKIGEFSKITNLTIKALRYYDEENILKPSLRENNGYRFYSKEDIKKAELINLLKELDFKIKEIKDVIDNCDNKEDLIYYLDEKKELIKINIQTQKQIIKKIDNYILPNNKEEENKMKYEIKEKTYDEMLVISTKFKGKYSDIGKHIGNLYKEAKGSACGPILNLYYNDSYVEQADIELCIPLKKKINSLKYDVKVLPKIKAISTIHIGSYDKINYAYKELFDYAKKNNIELDLPSALIYHKGPGFIFKGNPNKYITELVIPIKEV